MSKQNEEKLSIKEIMICWCLLLMIKILDQNYNSDESIKEIKNLLLGNKIKDI